jgi:hypothetical protein
LRRKASSTDPAGSHRRAVFAQTFPSSGKLASDSIPIETAIMFALVRVTSFAPASAVTSAVAPNHRHYFSLAQLF